MPQLYIAYGANLCKRNMRKRCPTARPVGKFGLRNCRLVFRGVADLEYSPGDRTPVGLWLIYPADERALDRFEGVSAGLYYKERGISLKFRGQRQNALIYLMENNQEVYPPSQFYVDTIRRGYEDFGLDERYLDEAIERSFLLKEPGEETRARRRRQRADQQPLVTMPESVAINRLNRRLSP